MLLELLREPGDARILLYVVRRARASVFAFGRSRKLAVSLGGTIVVRLHRPRRGGRDRRRLDERARPRAGFTRALSNWVIIPEHLANWVGPVTYMGLICLALGLTLLHGWARIILLIPTLYLATFVWENVLLAQPDATRYIVLGAMLIVLMVLRPNGLFGERRVEII